MCGRYTLRHQADEIAERFAALDQLEGFAPRFNIAPTQEVPVVLLDDQGRRVLRGLRWGLVPSWAQDPSIGNRMINARAETLAEKPAFRGALQRRRCLIPADGFYEWRPARGAGARGKEPVHFRRRDDALFAFAGLWEQWRGLHSFTVITVAPNPLVAPIHDRMPAMLTPEEEDRWLLPGGADLSLLHAYGPEGMALTPVSRRVNAPQHEGPECLSPPD